MSTICRQNQSVANTCKLGYTRLYSGEWSIQIYLQITTFSTWNIYDGI